MKREDRYLILKRKDIAEYLRSELGPRHDLLEALKEICNIVEEGRRWDNKRVFKAVVVEDDWTEYESTWKAIEKRVDSQEEIE